MVKYYGRARQRIGSVNTNQLGLKMSGCPSKVGRSGRIDSYISRRSHCNIVFCGWVRYHGIKWKYNHWVNPYTKEINWRCIPAAPITRALAGGVGRLNAPRFRCAEDCGRHPWWNWTNDPHSSPHALGGSPLPPNCDWASPLSGHCTWDASGNVVFTVTGPDATLSTTLTIPTHAVGTTTLKIATNLSITEQGSLVVAAAKHAFGPGATGNAVLILDHSWTITSVGMIAVNNGGIIINKGQIYSNHEMIINDGGVINNYALIDTRSLSDLTTTTTINAGGTLNNIDPRDGQVLPDPAIAFHCGGTMTNMGTINNGNLGFNPQCYSPSGTPIPNSFCGGGALEIHGTINNMHGGFDHEHDLVG